MGGVLAVLQAVMEVVEEDDIRILQLLLDFASNAGPELQSELVALVLRHQRIVRRHWNAVVVDLTHREEVITGSGI